MQSVPYKVLKFQSGEFVLQEGKPADGLILIRKGRVEIFRRSNGKPLVLGTAIRGQFIGEMSILLDTPCSASARAMEEVEVALFPRELCQKQLESSPNWLVSLSCGLASRLDLTNRRLEILEDEFNAHGGIPEAALKAQAELNPTTSIGVEALNMDQDVEWES